LTCPLAKLLLVSINSWLLAGLLYLGAGIGLTLYRLVLIIVLGKSRPSVHLSKQEWGWFAGAIIAGGVVEPVLQMIGLTQLPASGAALLLNAEGVFTVLLAWIVFRESFDRRILLGMLAIVAGTVVLSWPSGQISFGTVGASLALLGACLAWAVDNNLMRKVAASEGRHLVSGVQKLGASLPSLVGIGGALVLGSFAYGLSLALFIVGLRHLGTARTGAYFSVAPFFGATVAVVLLGDTLTLQLLAGAILMTLGVVGLHLNEKHRHEHLHPAEIHTHSHSHNLHHQHPRTEPVLPGVVHTHQHEHQKLVHSHHHFPDTYHQHQH
jgi:drug/metabolite transporter (DMT)-like permease